MGHIKVNNPPEYNYDALPNRWSIRLLKFPSTQPDTHNFHGALETYELDDCPPFDALSYTWGSPKYGPSGQENEGSANASSKSLFLSLHTRRGIPMDGGDRRRRDITENLYHGLHSIAQYKQSQTCEAYIWVDALCINQDDEDERNAQVLLMGSIYSQAQEVIVWLGKEIDMTYHAFQFAIAVVYPALKRLWARHGRVWLANKNPSDPVFWEKETSIRMSQSQWLWLWQNYDQFFNKYRWFHRAWVIQEVTLASRCSVIIGSTLHSWTEMMNLAFIISRLPWNVPSEYNTGFNSYGTGYMEKLFTTQRVYSLVFTDNTWPNFCRHTYGAKSTEECWYSTVAWLLRNARSSHASDDRDKIYSVYGIATKLLPPDITNPLISCYSMATPEVYMKVATMLLQHIPLLMTFSDIETGHRKYKSLPTWVPDYSQEIAWGSVIASSPQNRPFDASLSREEHGKPVEIIETTLVAQGTIVDTISVEQAWDLKDPLKTLQSLLKISLLLDPIYPLTGESSLEAIWRTLVFNNDSVSGERHIASPDIENAFHDWILFELVRLVHEHELETGTSVTYEWIISTLFPPSISFERARQWLPLMEDIQYWKNIYIDAARSGGVIPVFAVRRSGFFGSILESTIGRRRLYLTKKGYIGIGHRSLCSGDEVWLLKGGPVPYILHQNRGSGTHSLVGDTYLHGVMHGELAAGLKSQMSSVKIV